MTLNSETNIQEHDFRSFIELKGVFFIDTPVGLLKIPNRTKVIKTVRLWTEVELVLSRQRKLD